MKDGIYNGSVPYDKIDRLRNSTLVPFLQTGSVQHALTPKKQSWQMSQGIALHEYFLESVVSGKHQEVAEAIDESLKSSYSTAKTIIDNSIHEQIILWTHKSTGLKCKAKIDCTLPSLNMIADLKFTTGSAEPEGWMNRACNAGYMPECQVGFYIIAINQIGDIEYTRFCWIVIETKEPYGVSVIEAPQDVIYAGKSVANHGIEKWVEAQRKGEQGYPDRVVQASFPSWYWQKLDKKGLI